MFAQVHSPQTLKADELDRYLHLGWFRMGQTIFTTHFLNFKKNFYSAVWLRIDLQKFAEDNTQRKLFKRNTAFQTTIQPAAVTAVHEALYEKYKQNVTFEASASLKTLLSGRSPYKLYNTYEVNVHDGDKLIASGFFDLGKNASAGISSFYDPDYKKYSLGRYLIYQKVNFCQQYGMRYFYPGYFVPGYSFFDYKLSIGKPALEYLDLSTGGWCPIETFRENDVPLKEMRNKLTELQRLLAGIHVESHVLLYEYFDANLVPGLTEADLLDYPVILYADALNGADFILLVVYDIREKAYKLFQCISVWSSDTVNSVEGFYSSHLLKVADTLFAAPSAEKVISMLLMALAHGQQPDTIK